MRTRAYTWDNSVATELIAVLPIFGLDNLLHLMVSLGCGSFEKSWLEKKKRRKDQVEWQQQQITEGIAG